MADAPKSEARILRSGISNLKSEPDPEPDVLGPTPASVRRGLPTVRRFRRRRRTLVVLKDSS